MSTGGQEVDIFHSDGHFMTADGLALFYQTWMGGEKTASAIAIVHGYDEHSGRYERFARHFAPLGYAVYAFDLRGHGRSPGKRGYIDKFSEYVQDAGIFLDLVRRLEPMRRTILLGHSMGGLIAALHAEDPSADLPGLILSSPFLQLKMPVPIWKSAIASVLSTLAPSLPMPNNIPVEKVTHDRIIVEETRTDPLNHHIATPRWFTETSGAQKRAMERAPSIRAPIALLYAGDDYIAKPEATAQFYERLTMSDKVAHRYDGYYHEIFNEVARDRVYDDLHCWLVAREQ
jgi:alpha-beta hydrolase superfamily lysophospholipase